MSLPLKYHYDAGGERLRLAYHTNSFRPACSDSKTGATSVSILRLAQYSTKVSEDTYELVIRKDETLPQTCFSIRGQEHLDEYRTKDLFQPHPSVADVRCWRSRADDIIVFLNGEKTNPVSFEQHVVTENRELGGALVVGTQRFQAALLIDPVALNDTGPLTAAEQAALIERVWPTVQEANAISPAHARVEKSLVLVVD